MAIDEERKLFIHFYLCQKQNKIALQFGTSKLMLSDADSKLQEYN